MFIGQVGYTAPISKKGCVELVQKLSNEVKDARQASNFDESRLADREARVGEQGFRCICWRITPLGWPIYRHNGLLWR